MREDLRKNAILLAILTFVYLLASRHFYFLALVFATSFWLIRTRSKSVIIVLMLFLVASVPRFRTAYPQINEGRVIQVQGSYSILKCGRQKLIVYTDVPLLYDSIYSIDGEFRQIEESRSFYAFDFAAWAHAKGICYSAQQDQLILKEEGHSIRHCLQKIIRSVPDEAKKSFLYRTVLNIRFHTDDTDTWIDSNGFSYAGILSVIDLFMKYRVDRRRRRKRMIALNLILALIFRFPLLLVSGLIFRILSLSEWSRREQIGIGMCIVMLLYPAEITSVTFLIPSVYRLSVLFETEGRKKTFLYVLFLQSILFHHMNPIQNLLYPVLQKIYGFFFLYGLAALVLPLNILWLDQMMQVLFRLMNRFCIPGSVLGAGLLIYTICVLILRHLSRSVILQIILLIFFQLTGLFHPFAEVTFVNVSQGDCILIRMPLSSENILIDTGKSSQYSKVCAILEAKSIHHLDGLIITHPDDDHCANKEVLMRDYRPERVIETHLSDLQFGPLQMHDLNTIEDPENTNRSSLVHAFTLNGLTYLMMGDADEETEKRIAEKYPHLHADILKLSHHGSKTGSSDYFLDHIRPRIGMISSGSYSIYHHPSPETIQRLLKRHIPYFDTKNEGDITILALPFMNLLITSDWKVAIINGQ